jgi:hypothetical protein
MNAHPQSQRTFSALAAGAGVFCLLCLSTAPAASPTDTSLGTSAGFSITTGVDDTALGNMALKLNTTGVSNTAVGSLSLSSNVSGGYNTALGYGALQLNTASFNTAVGRSALYANTSGTNGVAVGSAALYANTTGNFNTGLGVQALRYTTTGGSNLAAGYQALYTNVTGSFNTAVGDGALFNSTGTGNIAIGEDSGYYLTSGSNNIDIGSQGLAGESNTIRIGTAGTQTDSYLAGYIHGDGSKLTNVVVPDGSITSTKIVANAVGSAQLATGAVSLGKIGTGAVTVANLLSSAAPAGGQVLSYDGANLAWTSPASGIWSVNGIGYPYYNGGGFVGIGTSNPAAGLHIVNSGGNTLRLDGATPRINFIDTGNTNTLTSVGAQAGSLYVSNNQSGILMQLTATGSLGLGTTSPQSRLHVSGAADALRLTGPTPFLTFENTTANFVSRIQANGGGMDLKTNGAVVNNHPGIIHLDQLGIVGLGTTAPLHQLSIRSFAGGPTWTSNGWIGAMDVDNASAIAWGSNTAGQRFGMGHTNGAFLMWRTASDPGTTGSAATYDFTITDVGNIGIGTTGPGAKLQVVSSGDIGTPQALLTQTTSADYARLRFTATGSPTGWDIAAGGTGGVMNFYAGSTNKNVMSLNPNGTASVQVLNITGGADLAEPFKMKEEKLEKGSVVVIDEEHPGRLKRSSTAYDTRVAGIVSGANGVNPGISLHQEGVMDGEQNVALSGRVYVEADTTGGPIRPGDLLTTSDLPGHAMRVTDHARAQGAIIGKAMSALDDGSGMVLVLVTLQ